MRHFSYFVRPTLFYLLLFAAYRLVFLILYVSPLEGIPHSERHLAFFYGLRLDLAIAAYIQFLPFLTWCLSFERIKPALARILRIYHVVVIVLVHLISVSNLVIYKFWDTLINWRALSYLGNPVEAAASVSFLTLVLLAILLLALIFASIWLFRKWFYLSFETAPRPGPRIFIAVCLAGLLLFSVRGGWQLLPMNESVAYYSSARQLNDAANNSMWHLGHSLKVATSNTNPFRTLEDHQAQETVDSLFAVISPDTAEGEALLKKNPNVVLIILESFSSDLLGCMGAKQSAAPFLDSLSTQGLLFTRIYASGFRTDQGLTSILSGFPATPVFSVINYPEKSASLPSLVKEFMDEGYHSSYYYGGTGNFRNMKAYCYYLGFQKFTDESDFPENLPHGKWGVHDEFVFLRQAHELDTMQQPFFSAVMSLSNHEPYDVPMKDHFPVTDDVSRFRNSAYYTDASLRKYFQVASTKPWFNNTLFVLVADHGHHYPELRDLSGAEAHHLPLLLYGNVLPPGMRGRKIDIVGNHHDLPATLLSLVGKKAGAFPWSKDLLSPGVRAFAFYEQDDGFGWIEPEGWAYYSIFQKKTILKSDSLFNESAMIHKGSAYLQRLYDQFLSF